MPPLHLWSFPRPRCHHTSRYLIHEVSPVYPAIAKAAGLEGEVMLLAKVDPNGRVRDVTVVRSVHRAARRGGQKGGSAVPVQTRTAERSARISNDASQGFFWITLKRCSRMARSGGRFIRDNAFMVAAIALPVLVAGLFILASAVPRWTVPPPSYDLAPENNPSVYSTARDGARGLQRS